MGGQGRASRGSSGRVELSERVDRMSISEWLVGGFLFVGHCCSLVGRAGVEYEV